MKKHTIIFITLILVFVFGGFFYENKNVSISKKAVQVGVGSQNVGLFVVQKDIYKTGEDNSPLPGVRFSLSTNNNTFESTSQIFSYDSNNQYYYFDEVEGGPEYYQDAYNTMSQTQKDYVNSITSYQDILDFYPNSQPICSFYDLLDELYRNSNNDGFLQQEATVSDTVSRYCVIYLPTYLTLEETKVPTGYVKEKYLVPGTIVAEYYVDLPESLVPLNETSPNSEVIPALNDVNPKDVSVDLAGIGVYAPQSDYYIPYGNADRNELTGLDIEKANGIWQRKREKECLRPATLFSKHKGTYPDGNPYVTEIDNLLNNFYGNGLEMCIENYKGTVSLEANAFVNNVESLTTSINQTLDYKVVVKNKGTVDAIDNVVRSTIPEGFVYVEGSASDNGVYKNGYVEWNIERLEEGSNKEFTYKAYAPNGINQGAEYVGNASVETFGLDEKVESNKTMVKLSFQNPYTATPVKIILLAIIATAVGVIYSVKHNQNNKQQTQE